MRDKYQTEIEKRIESFDPRYTITYSAHMQAYILHEYGQSGNESKDAAIPDGTLGHRSDAQCVHASGTGGRSCSDGQDGGD